MAEEVEPSYLVNCILVYLFLFFALLLLSVKLAKWQLMRKQRCLFEFLYAENFAPTDI